MACCKIVENGIEAVTRRLFHHFLSNLYCLEAIFRQYDALFFFEFALVLKEDELNITLVVTLAGDQYYLVSL